MGLKQPIFGVGHLVYVSTAANSTPVVAAVLQECSVSVKGTTKKLVGANRIAEDIALGEQEIAGKFKSGSINSGLFAAALPGATVTAGSMIRGLYAESTGVIAGATYTTTKTSGVIVLEVRDETGKPMSVNSTPSAGQYTVTTGGVFTFHSGATGKTYSVDYLYTDAAATAGYTVHLNNQAQGIAATFALYINNLSRGREFTAKFYNVTLPGLDLALKNGEYALPEGTFEAFADSSGNVLDICGELA